MLAHLIYQRPLKHFFIKINILSGGYRMIEMGKTLFHDAPDLGLLSFLGKPIKIHGLIDGPGKTGCIVVFKQKAVSGMF